MIPNTINLPSNQKIYFASDFHLGVPNKATSREREKKIVRWLESIENNATAIFILGDIFDFWFEYKFTVPKGFVRLQGKLALMRDKGIPIYFFTGNHDMWMFDYFPDELNIPVFKEPISIKINNSNFLIGHGDGLGPGDYSYKFLKKIFSNALCQWAFRALPSSIGMGIASQWSKRSRLNNIEKDKENLGEKEWLYQYCLEQEKQKHHDYYVFGHRHLPLEMSVGGNSKYINLGEWVNYFTYAEFDSTGLKIKKFE